MPVRLPAVHCLDVRAPASWETLPSCHVPTAGAPPSARLGHSQTIHEDRSGSAAHLYIFGGRQPEDEGVAYDGAEKITSLNDLHRLDLSTGKWEHLHCAGDTPSPRSYHQMVSANGSLFLFGGMHGDERYNDLYSFNPTTSEWRRLTDGPMEGRGGAGVCASSGGPDPRLWVIAGFCGRPVSDVWEYSMASGTWRAREDLRLPEPRSIFACGVIRGKPESGDELTIRVFGGELAAANANSEAGKYTDETLCL